MLNLFYKILNGNKELNNYDIKAKITRENIMHLSGEVDIWQHVVDIGHIAGELRGIKGVVNLITAKNIKLSRNNDQQSLYRAKSKGVIDTTDIVIIGAGVSGCAIARQLSKYNVKMVVLEKNSDIAEGTTKANNGMIHAGYDSKPGSLKAKMNVRGNALYTKWAKELNFRFKRTGSFVAGFDESDDAYLNIYLQRGIENGVPGIEILSGDEAREIEPNLHPSIEKVLWTPSAGYVEPYEVTLALAENAFDNGVGFMLETEVLDIIKKENRIDCVVTNRGIIKTKFVINAAGVYADEIAEMVGDRFYTIHPRRGSLIIFDKNNRGVVERFIGTPPKNFTKGGGPTQTPEGNPLWGPSAKEVPDKEDLSVDEEDIEFIMDKCTCLADGIKKNSVITFFSGLRASNYIEDFIIEISNKVEGFIHVAGIQSPGLASSPAIAERVEELFKEVCKDVKEKKDYNPIRRQLPCFRECTMEERDALIKEDSKYGHVICRCETITEAEIINAIHGKIPAVTVDAIKRRTRAGMGRCQGGFCGPRIIEILARELNIELTEVTQKGEGSEILLCSSRKV